VSSQGDGRSSLGVMPSPQGKQHSCKTNRRMTEKRNQQERFLNRELPVFAFFLLLSFIFWYLNELSKELQGTINYPVRYINPPKDRIVTGELPDKLEMDLRGPGYSILKVKLSGSRAPVVIDFSKITPRRIPGTMPEVLPRHIGADQQFFKAVAC